MGRAEWQAQYDRAPKRDVAFETMLGLPVEAVYGPDDQPLPGQYPYTRGVHASMYRSKLWTMRMFAGFGTAEDTNERFKAILAHGGGGLSTAFDLPTLMGCDSDDPLSDGEVGKCGVAVDTLADMEDLYRDIDLAATTTSMTINSPAAVVFAMYVATVRRGRPPLTARGHAPERHPEGVPGPEGVRVPATPVDAPGPGHDRLRRRRDAPLELGVDLRLPHPGGGLDRSPGAAFTLANGFAYVELARTFGLGVDEFAPRLLLLQRPPRLLRGDRQVPGRPADLGPLDEGTLRSQGPRSMMMRFHTQTAGVSLTAQQPEVNVARTAIEALAGVLGGTQSLHTNSFDEALALPTEKAARIALRTQQVIAHEIGVTTVADPLGGSWLVESLTDELERQAEDIFAHIDSLGDGSMLEGAFAGIDNGYYQSEIADAAYAFERKLNSGERVMVGVNRFTEGNEDAQPDLLEITAEQEMTQIKRLQAVRADRNGEAVAAALERLSRKRPTPRST